MAFYGMTRFAADLPLRRLGRWRSLGWTAARFAWVVFTLLVMTSPRVAVRAEAEDTNANRVPIEIIRFDRGASRKDISGAVIRGERSLYSIDARSGQRLIVSISAEEDNAVFQIYAPGARAERREDRVQGKERTPKNGAAFCRRRERILWRLALRVEMRPIR